MEGTLFKKGTNILNPYQPRYFITDSYYLRYDSNKDININNKEYKSIKSNNAMSPVSSPRSLNIDDRDRTSSIENTDKSIDLRNVLSVNPGIIGESSISDIDFHIITRDRNYQFRCYNSEECNVWLDCLSVYNGLTSNPSIPNRLAIAIFACIVFLENNKCSFIREKESELLRPLYKNILMNHQVALSQTKDSNLVFACLKLLLLKLPTTVLTSVHFFEFITNASDSKEIRLIYQKLPDVNRRILFNICKLFVDNKIAATELAAHFGLAFTDPYLRYTAVNETKDDAVMKNSLITLCITLLTSYKFIFDEFEEAALSTAVYSPRRTVVDDGTTTRSDANSIARSVTPSYPHRDFPSMTRNAAASDAGSHLSSFTHVSNIETNGRKISSAESLDTLSTKEVAILNSPTFGQERKMVVTKISAPPPPKLVVKSRGDSVDNDEDDRAKLIIKLGVQSDLLQKAKEREKELMLKIEMLSGGSITPSSPTPFITPSSPTPIITPSSPPPSYLPPPRPSAASLPNDKDLLDQLKVENDTLKSKLKQSEIDASKMRLEIEELNFKLLSVQSQSNK